MQIDSIRRGLVIDHISAGRGLEVYRFLKLDKLDCSVALIQNARSQKMGRKDIIKVEGPIDLDYDVLGFIDPNITVNIIENEIKVGKKCMELPGRVTDVVKCKNPRCISFDDLTLPHVFNLADRENAVYRCDYCEQKYERK